MIAQRHADARKAEAVAPAIGLAQIAAQHRGPEGPQIDAVVVEGEARIAAGVALFVELADDRGDVRLQEPHAHDDQGDGEVEDPDELLIADRRHGERALGQHRRQGRGGRQALDLQPAAVVRTEGIGAVAHLQLAHRPGAAVGRLDRIGVTRIGQRLLGRRALDRHGQVAGHQQKSAEGDGLARAQIAVRQHPADQRQQVHQRAVGAVLAARELVVEQEVLGQEEDQQTPHAVEGKPLPHLGEEQDEQALGVLSPQLDQHRYAGDDRDDHAQQDDDVVHARPATIRRSRPSAPCPRGRDDHASGACTSKAAA